MNHKVTPLMQQYFDIRVQYPDMLLFFQVGDFYELFFDDALQAAAFLGITLTKRGNHKGEPIPLCGVPIHTKNHYIAKLIKGGFKIALCDQLEEAKQGMIVSRGVTKVFTPATLIDDQLLDEKKSSYLCSFFPLVDYWGILFGELLTAQLFATVVPAHSFALLESELSRFFPDEILVPNQSIAPPLQAFFKQSGYILTPRTEQEIPKENLYNWLKKSFGEPIQARIHGAPALEHSFYNFYGYMHFYHQQSLMQFRSLQLYEPDDFLLLDAATQRNLELIKNNYDGGSNKYTLFSVMDQAVTHMGSRVIKKWLMRPLLDKQLIEERLAVVELCVQEVSWREQVQAILQQVGDIERIIGRIALQKGVVSDYVHLLHALRVVPRIKQLLSGYIAQPGFAKLYHLIEDTTELCSLMHEALYTEGDKNWIIRQGFHQELDQMRGLLDTSNHRILMLEGEEQKRSGISSLKIRYNNLQGYYIEISASQKMPIPTDYIHRQTLAGKIRYTIPALQQLEYQITDAQQRLFRFEMDLFDQIKQSVHRQVTALRKLSTALSHIDAFLGFARVAYYHNYIKPDINELREIKIVQGRHPVIERQAPRFVPNDTILTEAQTLWIITGPNMGGKSTYLRQVALICLLAQAGSFVPAESASLPILDRIFTRIGASDRLADGKSTFLVEMEETAAICSYATEKSLVILDEVGRGTSTFDGLAIARAVIEFLYTHVRCRTLFATHYHELSELSSTYEQMVNYHVACKKTDAGVIFLYQMLYGRADRSFGLEVAALANMPLPIIQRAQLILQQLERTNCVDGYWSIDVSDNFSLRKPREYIPTNTPFHKIQTELQNMDLEQMSAKQALDLLWKWKNQLDK